MLLGTYTMLFDSPIRPWSTLLTLIFVVVVSLVKEAFEDRKRHKADYLLNHRVVSRLKDPRSVNTTKVKCETILWQDVNVGNVLQLNMDEYIPADLILLASSDELGAAYLETSNIDGETNLKVKQCVHAGNKGSLWSSVDDLCG